jgi:histidine triad (HIT) family protein
LEADDETVKQTVIRMKKIAAVVMKAVGAQGFTASTNLGEAAGQSVFHLHFHIIPRFSNDGLKPWPQQEIEPKTRKEIAEEIKKNLPPTP